MILQYCNIESRIVLLHPDYVNKYYSRRESIMDIMRDRYFKELERLKESYEYVEKIYKKIKEDFNNFKTPTSFMPYYQSKDNDIVTIKIKEIILFGIDSIYRNEFYFIFDIILHEDSPPMESCLTAKEFNSLMRIYNTPILK